MSAKQTVVPGFEYTDHEFLEKKRLDGLLDVEEARKLEWLVRKD
jgi:predicted cupin superfamily sugar epimerase